jgi:hypothetical protein
MGIESQIKGKFFRCEECGRIIIERLPNGFWKFVFGRKRTRKGVLLQHCPVEMFIFGSVKMKCLGITCDHWTTLNFFPNVVTEFDNLPEPKSATEVEPSKISHDAEPKSS